MLCSKCGKRQASVHYKQVVNGKLTELYLCPQCANAMNAFGFDDFLPNLFGKIVKPQVSQSATCKKCGMTLSRLSKEGRLGCSECCDVFGEFLSPNLKRIHGSIKHMGKRPKSAPASGETSTVDTLKEELIRAISEERYEEAAKLRDKIRSIEGKAGGNCE